MFHGVLFFLAGRLQNVAHRAIDNFVRGNMLLLLSLIKIGAAWMLFITTKDGTVKDSR